MATDQVAAVETELTLLARHHLSSQTGPGRSLDRSAYHLLGRLELEPLSLGQLADAFRLDVSTVNRQVAALRRSGLVERIPDPEGGLAQLLRPTAKGLRSLHADQRLTRHDIGRVLAEWSVDDVAGLRAVLERLNTSIEHLEGRPWPRA